VAFVVFALIPDVPTSNPLTQTFPLAPAVIKGSAHLLSCCRWQVEGQRGRFVGLITRDDEVIE
jgi:hypothetical protein